MTVQILVLHVSCVFSLTTQKNAPCSPHFPPFNYEAEHLLPKFKNCKLKLKFLTLDLCYEMGGQAWEILKFDSGQNICIL